MPQAPQTASVAEPNLIFGSAVPPALCACGMEISMVKKIKNNDLSEVKASGCALVDFSATWCGPCNMLAPVLEELSDEMDGVAFFNADAEANMELSSKYGVTSIPALFIFRDGRPVAQTVGFQPKEVIKGWIESNRN